MANQRTARIAKASGGILAFGLMLGLMIPNTTPVSRPGPLAAMAKQAKALRPTYSPVAVDAIPRVTAQPPPVAAPAPLRNIASREQLHPAGTPVDETDAEMPASDVSRAALDATIAPPNPALDRQAPGGDPMTSAQLEPECRDSANCTPYAARRTEWRAQAEADFRAERDPEGDLSALPPR